MSALDAINSKQLAGAKQPVSLFHAQMDAPGNDRLHAYGATEAEAKAALHKGFKAHLSHFDMTLKDWQNQTGHKDPHETNVEPVQTGKAYRHGTGELHARPVRRG